MAGSRDRQHGMLEVHIRQALRSPPPDGMREFVLSAAAAASHKASRDRWWTAVAVLAAIALHSASYLELQFSVAGIAEASTDVHAAPSVGVAILDEGIKLRLGVILRERAEGAVAEKGTMGL